MTEAVPPPASSVLPSAERRRPNPYQLRREQYLVILDHVRRGHPLDVLASSPDLASSFRPQIDDILCQRVSAIMQRSLQAGETIEGFLLRFTAPLIGRMVARAARSTYELSRQDIEQEAKLKFLQLIRLFAQDERLLPDDPEAFVKICILNLLHNHRVRDRRQQAHIPLSVEGFQERITTEDGIPSGLDVLSHGHQQLHDDLADGDPEAIALTHDFWEDVRRIVGPELQVALLRAHVLHTNQRQVAQELGLTYRSARDRLMKARRALRQHPQFREDWGPQH